MSRNAKVERKTKETKIQVSLELDGAGKSKVECDNQFLRHMLETFSKYSSFDLQFSGYGDNEHHLVEDSALALGSVFREALGTGPVSRMASITIPMDDALIMVSVDIIDRPFADIDSPDVLYHHFFRSFAMSSGITLHIIAFRGIDNHHITEASFKALGLALKQATVPREELLSTKDVIEFRRG